MDGDPFGINQNTFMKFIYDVFVLVAHQGLHIWFSLFNTLIFMLAPHLMHYSIVPYNTAMHSYDICIKKYNGVSTPMS